MAALGETSDAIESASGARGPLSTLAAAAHDLRADWKTLAGIEVYVTAIAFVVLTPMTQALVRMLISGSGSAAVTDADIALFFFTTVRGIAALLLLIATSVGILALAHLVLDVMVGHSSRSSSMAINSAMAASSVGP